MNEQRSAFERIAEPISDDENAVTIDRRDLRDSLRAAWRDGQSYGSSAEAVSWSESTDYAHKVMLPWVGTIDAPVKAVRTTISDAQILATLAKYEIGWGSEDGVAPFTGDVAETYVKAIRALLAAQGDTPEPLMWESTTPAYTRFITQSKYEKFSYAAQAWYRPICQKCAQGDAPGDDGRLIELGKAVERAAKELPIGVELHIELERDAGTVRLYLPPQGDDDAGEALSDWGDDNFADQINQAIDAAIAVSTQKEKP